MKIFKCRVSPGKHRHTWTGESQINVLSLFLSSQRKVNHMQAEFLKCLSFAPLSQTHSLSLSVSLLLHHQKERHASLVYFELNEIFMHYNSF